MTSSESNEVYALYKRLIEAWNNRDASAMAELFTEGGEMIGFDGSLAAGNEEIFSHLSPIFNEHPTPPFVWKVKSERELYTNTRILRAIVGMVPPGKKELEPSLNAHQTLVAVKQEGTWRIGLFQNTPAQFQGRPELVEQMTDELKNS
ncbi:SgcJ/EcaC family oxidoreductase [Virgibacillus necropolis]|uniref:SgcJ/EcaC family oxidoreductase n=1 Tax=Virgibacillus necropolis TaxID=163877 RepID=UPI00384AA40D